VMSHIITEFCSLYNGKLFHEDMGRLLSLMGSDSLPFLHTLMLSILKEAKGEHTEGDHICYCETNNWQRAAKRVLLIIAKSLEADAFAPYATEVADLRSLERSSPGSSGWL
ncbi:hypothetical protein PENTCL1PPCAC_1593, partial [Pristionchus entomophagus]